MKAAVETTTEWSAQRALQMIADERVQLLKEMHSRFGTIPGEGGPHQSFQAGYETALRDAFKRIAGHLVSPSQHQDH